MARKKSTSEQGVSMDSLMDALTNVVAVLIVILILLQVDVTHTVEKMLNDLKPATPEQIESANEQKQLLAEQIKKQELLLNAPKPTSQELDKIKADLSLLETTLDKNSASLLELKELKKQVATRKPVESEERQKSNLIMEEISRIKALLDQTPIPKAPQPTVVKIPNSRDIPDSAKIFYCYIVNDQAHLVDIIEAKKMVMAEFDKNQRTLLRSVKKIPKKPDIRIYDQEKTVKIFAAHEFKIRNQTITVPYNKPWSRLRMNIAFDPKNGDATLADMQVAKGRFHNICNYVRSTSQSVLIFKVNTDGFETYLKAREIADAYNIPCGWEIDGNKSHNETLDFLVNNLEQPPAPKPDATPPKPGPKRKLD